MRCVDLVSELANYMVSEGLVPVDWQVSSIVNSYNGKGNVSGMN